MCKKNYDSNQEFVYTLTRTDYIKQIIFTVLQFCYWIKGQKFVSKSFKN